MKMQIVALFDAKAQVYSELWATPTVGTATRQVQDLVRNKDSQHPAAKWPADFQLWHLGEYDTESGLVQALPHPDDGSPTAKKLLIHCETLANLA